MPEPPQPIDEARHAELVKKHIYGDPERRPGGQANWFRYSSAASIGIEIAVAIVGCTLLARWIELRYTHWGPWTTSASGSGPRSRRSCARPGSTSASSPSVSASGSSGVTSWTSPIRSRATTMTTWTTDPHGRLTDVPAAIQTATEYFLTGQAVNFCDGACDPG